MINVILYPHHFSELSNVIITHTCIIPAYMIREQEDNLFLTVIGNTRTIKFKYGLDGRKNIFREDSAGDCLLDSIAQTKVMQEVLRDTQYVVTRNAKDYLTGNLFWFSPINRKDTEYNIWVVEIMKHGV